MLENLKISKEGKEGVVWLKNHFNFSTYSVAINTAVSFFKNNNVSPREVLNGNNISSMLFDSTNKILESNEDIKSFIRTDSQSLRKRHGAIEKEYFIIMKRQLEELSSKFDNLKGNLSADIPNNFDKKKDAIAPKENKKNDNINFEKEIINLKKVIENKNITVVDLEKLLEDKIDLIYKLDSNFENIKSNIIVEKGIVGRKKYVLDIDEENYNKMML